MVRNAMLRRVELVARDDLDGLVRLERAAADRIDPPREVVMTRSAWDAAIEDYYAEHDAVRPTPTPAGPDLLRIEARGSRRGREAPRAARRVTQTLARPGGPPRLGDRGRGRPATPPTRPASWCCRHGDARLWRD